MEKEKPTVDVSMKHWVNKVGPEKRSYFQLHSALIWSHLDCYVKNTAWNQGSKREPISNQYKVDVILTAGQDLMNSINRLCLAQQLIRVTIAGSQARLKSPWHLTMILHSVHSRNLKRLYSVTNCSRVWYVNSFNIYKTWKKCLVYCHRFWISRTKWGPDTHLKIEVGWWL